MPIFVKCHICNKEIEICPSRYEKNTSKEFCCSKSCMSILKTTGRIPNYTCVICGKFHYQRPSKIKNNSIGLTCSKECFKINKKNNSIGEKNHQYGLKGKLNASFKSGRRISNYGYVLIYKPEHERANCNGYVFEHILVMEKHIGRKLKFISKLHKDNEVVHHVDFNKKNNSINNLNIMKHGEHVAFHNKLNHRKRTNKGTFMKTSTDEAKL